MATAKGPQQNRPAAASWRLQDAKARFSEVVRLARESGPQHVTLHGQEAVVVVSAETWKREHPERSGKFLVDILAGSPLSEVDIDRNDAAAQARDVDL